MALHSFRRYGSATQRAGRQSAASGVHRLSHLSCKHATPDKNAVVCRISQSAPEQPTTPVSVRAPAEAALDIDSSNKAQQLPERESSPSLESVGIQSTFPANARYSLADASTWLSEAPRVRIRSAQDRRLDELVELTVLNERLNGTPSWTVRRRLEYLKLRRRNWEAIYHYINSTDAVATLALIEEANRKVEQTLSDESQQRMGVGELQQKLLSLRDEVEVAAEKLQSTQSRVAQNLKRVNQLKAEAATLERLRSAPTGSEGMLPAFPRQSNATKRDRGLKSTLEMENELREFWLPAAFSKTLGKDTLMPVDLFGENWVLFRDENGQAACIKDTCAHRSCPLSLGKVEEGKVVCPYHGWQFDSDGQCTKMPSTAFCRNVAVAALPCEEKDGFVWVWPGRGQPPDEVPGFTAPPPGFKVHAEIMVEVPVEHGLLIENLLDLAHAPFTHTTTFARGWPIPEAVRFHATRMLSGHWDPYPINMSFQPPCVTVSNIGLAQPGKIMRGVTADKCRNHLHQLHVCMPAKKGHTRLLYRMSMDFMGWIRFVPGIQQIWKRVAAQVLGEDLVLVNGQQDRMQKGADTWANPMAYDKLAVRYRRWRNSLAAGDVAESRRLAAEASMTAGELFTDDDEPPSSDVTDDTTWLNAQQVVYDSSPPSSSSSSPSS